MPNDADSEFTDLLVRESRDLFGFVHALVGDPDRADDLFQASCLEIWRIRETFHMGTDFGAWARTVARFQVLRAWKRERVERRIFSREAVEAIERAYDSPESLGLDEERRALDLCLEALPEDVRGLLRERYAEEVPVREMALRRETSEAGLKMRLLRLRKKLADCVRARLSEEAVI
jgi:RNA polymerase sigma-70 factor (ECF subfamily)